MFRVFSWVALCLVAGSAYGEKLPAVASIDARLFFNYSGTLSEPITNKTVLWNSIIGEGKIPEPSNSTFIDVIVDGEPGSFKAGLRTELVVSDSSSGKMLQTQIFDVGVLHASGKYHAGFWIAQTGCQPLRLRASIVGTKAYKTITVPFHCGE